MPDDCITSFVIRWFLRTRPTRIRAWVWKAVSSHKVANKKRLATKNVQTVWTSGLSLLPFHLPSLDTAVNRWTAFYATVLIKLDFDISHFVLFLHTFMKLARQHILANLTMLLLPLHRCP